MSDSSFIDKTIFRTAYMFIESELDIESLGRLVSEKLVGGLPFGGLENHIRDEIPAIYINDILGCRLILLGSPGEGYNLELVEYYFPHYVFRQEGRRPIEVDMSGNLYHILEDIGKEIRTDERFPLTDQTIFRNAHVFIKSELDIESLGRLISEKLAGGLPFGGLEEHMRDEIPAIYINNILGCRLILLGFSGERGYNLKLVEHHFPFHFFEQGEMPPNVDMSGNLYHLLKGEEGIEVSLE